MGPLLSPRGLGILCHLPDTKRSISHRPERMALSRSISEPVAIIPLGTEYTSAVPSPQEGTLPIWHHSLPVEQAGARNHASALSHQSNAPGMIDLTGCTPTTSPPPLPRSARRISTILPPRVFANQLSPSSCQNLSENKISYYPQGSTSIDQLTVDAGLEDSTIGCEPTEIDLAPMTTQLSRLRLQRTRRSALHPGHPYALEADSFASAFGQSMGGSETAMVTVQSAQYENRCSLINISGPLAHVAAQRVKKSTQVPPPRPISEVPIRPGLHPRHHTDTLLASVAYRKDSFITPSAPKLPWHRIFDGPLPSKGSE